MSFKTVLIFSMIHFSKCLDVSATYFGYQEILLIGDFFSLKNIHHGTVFGCGSHFEMVTSAKELSKFFGISIAFKNLNTSEFNAYNNSKNTVHRILNDIPTFRIGNVLDMNCNTSHHIIEAASDLELFDEIHPWLLIAKNFKDAFDILSPMNFRLDSEVFLAIKNIFNNDPWIVYDLHNPGFEIGGKINFTFYGLWKPSKNFMITSSAEIADLIDCENSLATLDKTSSMTFYNMDDTFVTACNYLIRTILKIHHEDCNKIGNWRVYLIQDKIERRGNLQRLVIDATIAITFKPPKGGFMKYISTATDVSKDTMHRHGYAMFVILMDIFNFRMKVIRTDSWGVIKNGSWTGVIGALVRRQAEISITPTQFKTERVDIADQTAVTWLARPCFIFRHPRNAGLRSGFTKPLAPTVWWATLAIFVGIAVALRLALQQEARASTSDDLQYSLDAEEDNSWSYTILVALAGVFCQQGFAHTPNMFSGRSMIFLSLVFTFLLFQFYSASIVSSLLSEPPRKINSLKSLLESNLKLLIEDIPYMWDFFESTTDPLAIKLYKEKVIKNGKTDNYVMPEYGLPKVKEGGYAFHVDIATAYKLIPETFEEQSICDLSEIQLFPPKPTIILVRKGSPYRQMISLGLRKIHERGILQYHRAVWHHPKPKCSLTGASKPVSVALPETGLVFLMLACSYVTSFAILGIECWIDRNKHRLTRSYRKCCKTNEY